MQIIKIPGRFQCIAHYRPAGITVLLAVISLLGTFLILLSQTGHGPYVSPDSINYIVLARNLMDGNGYVTWSGKPVAIWPPGYPILLSLFSLSFFDPLDAAGAINAITLGLIAFVTGHWLMQRIKSSFLILWGCVAIVFAVPLRLVSSSVWSEPAFILFITLSLIWMDKYLSTEKRSSLIVAAVFTAFACLTRYAGIALVIAILTLLVLQRGVVFQNKLRRIGLYLMISVAPLGIWLMRNMLALGTLTGTRPPAETALQDNVHLALNTLVEWWQNSPQFTTAFQPISVPVTTTVLLVSVILVSYAFILWRKDAGKSQDKNFILVFGMFGFVYLVFIIWAATTSNMDPLNHRLLSPAYIPLLVLILFMIDRLFTYCSENSSFPRTTTVSAVMSALPVIVVIVLSLWTGWAGHAIVKKINMKKTIDNYGYRSIVWRESQTLQYLQEYRPTRIYSNAPQAVYINSEHYQTISYGYLPRSIGVLAEWTDRQHLWPENTYIVWFNREYLTRRYDYDASYLSHLPGFETVAKLADGVIVKIKPSLKK